MHPKVLREPEVQRFTGSEVLGEGSRLKRLGFRALGSVCCCAISRYDFE